MTAVLTKAVADVRRRRLQTGVIFLVTTLSVLAATMALSLLVESNAPYDHAFNQAHGPHLVMIFDGTRATEAQIAATTRATGVTEAIGPLPTTNAQIEFTRQRGQKGPAAALRINANIVGRAGPDLAVDRLTLYAGRWATTSSEVVLSDLLAKGMDTSVGDTIRIIDVAGSPSLTVVGIAASISRVADAWVMPAAVSSLTPVVQKSGRVAPPQTRWMVEYRVADANDANAIATVSRAISGGLPSGSVVGSISWLDSRKSADLTAAVMVPFLVAFSALGLLAAAFVISNVVAGVVIADRRQMGIMKSIGFTPAQVGSVLVAQVLIPVAIGSVVGIPLGTLVSEPFLNETAQALGLPTVFTDATLVYGSVVGLVLVITLAASIWPSIKAGRMSAVSAIAVGTGPSSSRGAGTIARLSRLPLRPPLRLGVAALAARPVRAVMSGVAVLIGVATVVFAVGLTLSLHMVASSLSRDQQVQVDVQTAPDRSGPPLSALISTTPGTSRFVAEGRGQATVPGIPSPIPYYGYDGSSAWIGYAMISGRWFDAPGEVVAPSHLLDVTGLKIGQSFTATFGGESEQLTLVGEIFDQTNDDLLLRGSWSDVSRLDPTATIDEYEIQLRPGTDARAYASTLQSAGGPSVSARPVSSFSAEAAFLLIEGVLSGLALVLAGIAAAGVFNTVVLGTRERRREIAILKAIGMDPSQVVLMVVSSVAAIGFVAAVVAVPLGLVMHHQILTSMAEIATNTRVPASFYSVLGPTQLAGLTIAGVAIATAGAWLPAQWAAAERVSAPLQAE